MNKRLFSARQLIYWLSIAGLAGGVLYNTEKVRAQTYLPCTVTLQAGGMTYVFATRSDGATAFVHHSSSLPAEYRDYETRVVHLALSRERVQIAEGRKLKSTTVLSATAWPFPRSAVRSCTVANSESAAGIETISGYRTSRVSQRGRTSWYALDYGCALVKEIFQFQGGEVSEKVLVSLEPGEPAAVLFEAPSSYSEVPPSVLMMTPGREYARAERLADEEYFKAR
jgi:hypothetical protein